MERSRVVIQEIEVPVEEKKYAGFVFQMIHLKDKDNFFSSEILCGNGLNNRMVPMGRRCIR